MRKLLFALPVLTLLVVSCQKEQSFNDPDINGPGGGGSGTTGTQLAKQVTYMGSDSTVTLFGYNSSRKLTLMDLSGTEDGEEFDLKYTLERNAQGIIQRVILQSSQLQQLGLDKIVSRVNYNAASSRYDNRVTSIEYQSFMLRDSVAYSYDASGRVTSEKQFTDQGTGTYEEESMTEYTYAGNNITRIKTSTRDASTNNYVEESTSTYEYDTKKQPLQLGVEALLMSYPDYFSANNATKIMTVYPSDPTENTTFTVNYTYNTDSKPATSSILLNGNQMASVVYFYQ